MATGAAQTATDHVMVIEVRAMAVLGARAPVMVIEVLVTQVRVMAVRGVVQMVVVDRMAGARVIVVPKDVALMIVDVVRMDLLLVVLVVRERAGLMADRGVDRAVVQVVDPEDPRVAVPAAADAVPTNMVLPPSCSEWMRSIASWKGSSEKSNP